MHAKNFIAARIGEHFDKTVRMSDAQRAAIGREWKLPGLVGAPFPFELLLGIADPGNFGRGIMTQGIQLRSRCGFCPSMISATITPSSSALCASIGPRTTSPIASILGARVRQ